MRNILIIARKEIASWLDNPAGYVAIVVFVLLWEGLFFRNAFLIGEASIRGMYDLLPWLMLLLSAAVTMGAVAKEESEGTLELLLTQPISELEAVVGKFGAAWVVAGTATLFSLPVAIGFSRFGNVDFGVVVGQIISGWMVAGGMVAVGLAVSAWVKNQVAAMLVSAVVLFGLVMAGTEFVAAGLPLAVAPVLEQLSILNHAISLGRGVVDVRDGWYFVSLAAVGVSLAWLGMARRSRKLVVGGVIVIAVVTNVFGQGLGWRWDLTRGQAYTLSTASRKIVGNLSEQVTINFYVSNQLPSQFAGLAREVRDTLADLRQAGKGKIAVAVNGPEEAAKEGLQEIQFNVIGQEEFQVKTGYLGLVVQVGEKKEVIPAISDASDLEYQLVSLIVKLTDKEKEVVAFDSGRGEKNLFADLGSWEKLLSDRFEVINVSKADEATRAAILVLAGPTSWDREGDRMVKEAKSILWLGGGYEVNTQFLMASQVASDSAKWLEDFGVKVGRNVVYDLRSSEVVKWGQGNVSLLLPYPFWVVARAEKGQVIMPWAQTVEGGKPLVVTSQFAGTEAGSVNIAPDKLNLSREGLGQKTLAVMVEEPKRMIAVGNVDFVTEAFARNAPQNLAFATSAVEWLVQAEGLAGIKAKQANMGRLVVTPEQAAIVKYGNMTLPVVLAVVVGGVRARRRRKFLRV